jgi:polyphosphate kinase
LLQIELVKMQAWVKEVGERIVMLFEGRDAAGKGGTIQRFTENLNPRGARVVALAKPSDAERGQWYFQRYIENLPTKGQIIFFDRSWYNRSGVEHVMGFCSPREYLEFMRQAPEFERMMVRTGIRLFKFWFSVSREEQLRRFLGRAQDPFKRSSNGSSAPWTSSRSAAGTPTPRPRKPCSFTQTRPTPLDRRPL